MRKESQIIGRETGFTILEIGREQARRMTDFVFDEYVYRFQGKFGVLDEDDRLEMLISDLFTLNNSTIFAAVADSGAVLCANPPVLGTIRIIERVATLPAEKEFGFDARREFDRMFPETTGFAQSTGAVPECLPVPARLNRIFEIGRFATSPENLQAAGFRKADSLFVTDCLLRSMFAAVSREPGNVAVASLDVTTLRILKMRGIHFREIDEPRYVLGSPAVPVILPVDLCLEELRRSAPERFHFYLGQALPADRVPA